MTFPSALGTPPGDLIEKYLRGSPQVLFDKLNTISKCILVDDILTSIAHTPELEHDISIFVDMYPGLSTLDEFPPCSFREQFLSYCTSKTFQPPKITTLPLSRTENEPQYPQINYNRLFLAYSISYPFIPAFEREIITRYNDIPSHLRKQEELSSLGDSLVRAQSDFTGAIIDQILGVSTS